MKKSAIAFGAIILLSFSACTNSENEMEEKTEKVVENLQDEKNELQAVLNSAMEKLDAQIITLEEDIVDASEDKKHKLEEEMETLKQKRSKFNEMLEEIANETEESWKDFRSTVKSEFRSLDALIFPNE